MSTLKYLEKSATRQREYVAYINGAQRVRRYHAGWETYALGSSAGEYTYVNGRTLADLDAKIGKLRQPPYVPTLAR